MLRDPVGPRAPKQPSFTSNFRDWWKLRSDPNNTAKAERLWSLLLVVFFPVVVIGGNWRGGVRCSETPWGQGRPNTTYPMGRLRVLHGLRCRWVGTVAVVVGGRGSRWGGGLSGRGKGYPCEGVGCGKGGWGSVVGPASWSAADGYTSSISPRSGYPKWARLLSSVKFCKGFAGGISGTTPCGWFDLLCSFRTPYPGRYAPRGRAGSRSETTWQLVPPFG